MKVLRDLGLVVEDHNRQRRGALEHFYKAVAPTVVPANAWDSLPAPLRKGVSARILQKFLRDVESSVSAGVFDAPPGDLCWTPLVVDDLGISEIDKLTDDFLESLLVVQSESSDRLSKGKQGHEDAKSFTVFLASFFSARRPKEGKRASCMVRR